MNEYYESMRKAVSSYGIDMSYVDRAIAQFTKENKEVSELELLNLASKYMNEDKQKKEVIREMEMNVDHTTEIYDWLYGMKSGNVLPRELADTFYEMLSPSERKDVYCENVMYACYKNLDNPLMADALKTCLDRYKNSVLVKETLAKYCQSKTQNRDEDSMIIQRLANACPTQLKTGDVNLDAYETLMETKRTKGEQFTEKNSGGFFNKVAGRMAASIDRNEPYRVACDYAIDDAMYQGMPMQYDRSPNAMFNSMNVGYQGTTRSYFNNRMANNPDMYGAYNNMYNNPRYGNYGMGYNQGMGYPNNNPYGYGGPGYTRSPIMYGDNGGMDIRYPFTSKMTIIIINVVVGVITALMSLLTKKQFDVAFLLLLITTIGGFLQGGRMKMIMIFGGYIALFLYMFIF